MTPVDLPLPSRPLAVVRKSVEGAGNVFGAVFLLGLAAFFLVWQAPGLWRDWQISQHPVTVRNGQVIDGECTTRRGLTDCEARLVYSYNGVSYDTEASMAFVDFSSGDYQVEVVISGEDPSLATMDLGLEKLWNRSIVLTVLVLLTGGGGLALLFQGIAAWRTNRAVARPGAVRLVPVGIASSAEDRRGVRVSYTDTLQGKARTTGTRFPRGAGPMMAAGADGLPFGVAIKHDGAARPILLDSRLERLDLTGPERERALAAHAAAQPDAAHYAPTPAPRRKPRILRGILAFFAVIFLFAAAAVGYWLWYVTSAGNAYDPVGMEINNVMPGPLNRWGCGQLSERFDRLPFGCAQPGVKG